MPSIYTELLGANFIEILIEPAASGWSEEATSACRKSPCATRRSQGLKLFSRLYKPIGGELDLETARKHLEMLPQLLESNVFWPLSGAMLLCCLVYLMMGVRAPGAVRLSFQKVKKRLVSMDLRPKTS